jgi:hypothetical protein
MTAKFELIGQHEPVIVLTPDCGDEAILMAAFLKYDANVFTVSVERYENGRIRSVELRGSAA